MSRGLRAFGHPLHAALSDFPVALLGTSLVWDLIGVWRNEAVWWAISFWNMALGLAVALLAAMAGAVDYAAIKRERALKMATTHMVVMLLAVSMYAASLLWRGGPSPPVGVTRVAGMILESAGLILLMAGGWLGGHLVFHHGVGSELSTDG
jgi:uncharacterized membrane protein